MYRSLLIAAQLAAVVASAGLPEDYGQIILSRQSSPDVEASAADLAGLLERTYGERPLVRFENLLGGPRGIHVGPVREHPAFDGDPLTDEVVVERTRRGLEIRGSDNTTTAFAVYRFAENMLGWRYFQPGPLGMERLDDPPKPPSVAGPEEILLLEKAGFLSRNPDIRVSPGASPNWRTWHGLRERFVYNHSLHKVLPPDKFADHPDWFAKDTDGRPIRQPYPQPHGYNHHPDLANPEVRNWVARQTLTALTGETASDSSLPQVRQSPGLVSTSLSLGDSYIFGSFPDEYPWDPDDYFRRWPDWSNHVFAYTNEVANAISASWRPQEPGQRLALGALAYLRWENIPDFPVHSSVVPYLTFDRSQWHDPDARRDDPELVSQWSLAGPEIIGTWDYIFGYGYLIPRSLRKVISESIPALHERGVRAYYSQVSAIWPYDGVTNWLAARLLWQPQADAAALEAEFFREFYGPAAAPMRAFHDKAESLWMGQEGKGWWLRYWKDPWQAALWDAADIEEMEETLQQAQELDRMEDVATSDGLSGSRFLARVQEVGNLFQLTSRFVEYMRLSWELQGGDWESADSVGIAQGLNLALKTLEARDRFVGKSAEVRQQSPNSRHAHDLTWPFRYDGIGAAIAALRQRAGELGMSRTYGPRLDVLMLAWSLARSLEGRPAYSGVSSVLRDQTFASIEDPGVWRQQSLESEGMFMGSGGHAAGYTAKDVRRGHIFQVFEAQEGHFYLGSLDLESIQSPSGEIYIRLDFFNGKELLAKSARGRLAPVAEQGAKQRIRVLWQAPEGTTHGRILVRFYEMDEGSEADLFRINVLDLGYLGSP
ncbi:MAG: DUF4838 domain-containing protein [Puniceicoccaceae bacterium]